ncbi:hypothetical protein I79_017789 [Cricetulus griseus]|uniref:Uncharacterized protein n=1 Tax=Cricetulus griseus TaxID=10029 RepID=G3I2Z1_CRIGR|nr:hypothetical protein I79_017789 [Cricetulus griseus]
MVDTSPPYLFWRDRDPESSVLRQITMWRCSSVTISTFKCCVERSAGFRYPTASG